MIAIPEFDTLLKTLIIILLISYSLRNINNNDEKNNGSIQHFLKVACHPQNTSAKKGNCYFYQKITTSSNKETKNKRLIK